MLDLLRGTNTRRRVARGLPGLIMAALALASCGRPPAEFTPPPPPEVTVAHPVQRMIPDVLEFTATTRGASQVEVRARVAGFLDARHTDGGIRVTEGQDLFTLDVRPFQAAVREAEAVLRQRQFELDQAELTLEREQEAIARGGSNPQQVDEATAARDVASALVDLAQAQLDRAELDEEWAHIRAPIAGRMGFAQAEEGDLIEVNDWLATIIDDSRIYAVYDVDERTLLELRERYNNLAPGEGGRPDLEVRLGLSNEQGFPHVGRFYRMDAGVNPQTGTIRVEAEFDNPDGVILPGTFVRVQPVFGDRPALLVPDIAIQADQGGRYVLTVDDAGAVHRVPILLDGPVFERLRPIVEDTGQDLAGGEPTQPQLTTESAVIVNGLQRVRAGMQAVARFEGEEPAAGHDQSHAVGPSH